MNRGSRILVAVPAACSALLAVARWLAQGSGNVYTDLGKRFYVPDPALGWRLAPPGPVWLGLDSIGALAGATVAIAVASLVLGRRGRQVEWLTQPDVLGNGRVGQGVERVEAHDLEHLLDVSPRGAEVAAQKGVGIVEIRGH